LRDFRTDPALQVFGWLASDTKAGIIGGAHAEDYQRIHAIEQRFFDNGRALGTKMFRCNFGPNWKVCRSFESNCRASTSSRSQKVNRHQVGAADQ
jgi:hypothetical protein